jgi:hypothetical protein
MSPHFDDGTQVALLLNDEGERREREKKRTYI